MHKSIHSALGYLTPVELALQWQQAEMDSVVIPKRLAGLCPTLGGSLHYAFHGKDGQPQQGKKYFYGYKLHASFNAGAQMITNLEVSTGDRRDNAFLCDLIRSDLAQGLAINTCVADRGYDDTDTHYSLQQLGIRDAIHLVRTRTQKKDTNKQVWQRLIQAPWYRPALGTRYQIERKFGEAKP
jgi:hypothetical protein